MSRDDELEEAIERLYRTLSKTLLVLSRCRILEDIDFVDMLSLSKMHVDNWDGVAFVV
jgi:hypothetical protein